MKRALPLLLAACAGAPPDDEAVPLTEADRVATWEAFGPERVAYTETSTTYADPVSQAPRTLRIGLWYPTDAEDGETAHFSGPLAPDDVLRDAAPSAGPRPLWLFSHGNQGDIDNCSRLMAHAASHGWVAAAVEHTGNTLSDGDHRTTAIYVQRPHDVSAALDALLADDALVGGLDGRVFGTGHSFGGYTTFLLAGASWAVDYWDQACAEGSTDAFCDGWTEDLADQMRAGAADPRIAAFATLSGGNWGQIREDGFATLHAPLLQVSGALDASVSNEGNSDPIWRDLAPGDKVRADIAHGDHQTYTDFADTFGGLLPGTSADALDAARGHRIVQVLTHAFAAREVLGETEGLDGLLDGSFLLDEDVTVSTR